MTEEPDLRPRIYWAVAIMAVVVMAMLWWFTAAFNVTPGAAG